MATYKGILTNNGKALLASATVANPVAYSHLAVGDGNGSTPAPLETRSKLVNEKARVALNVVEINPNNTNQIVCEGILPTNVGGFHIREFGLFADSVMIVNGNYPLTYKPAVNEGGAREIAIKVIINVQNADVVALYLDDSLIYATREWVKNNYLQKSNNLSDILNVSTARTNLGLGTAATRDMGNNLGNVVPAAATSVIDFNELAGGNRAAGFFQMAGSAAENYPNSESNMGYAAVIQGYRNDTPYGLAIFANADTDPKIVAYALPKSADGSRVLKECRLHTSANTTVDANGFLRSWGTDHAVPYTRTITAGTGLSGGGNLSANRTLSVNYGTTAGTAAQGNDSRLSDSREWTATTVSQAEAEAGTATTRRAWTAQRVRQAATAMLNAATTTFTRTLLGRTTAVQVRSDLELGTAATRDMGNNLGNVVPAAATSVIDFNELAGGNRAAGFFQMAGSAAENYPNSESNMGYAAVIQGYRNDTPYGLAIFANADTDPKIVAYALPKSADGSRVLKECRLHTSANTTVDANGFLRSWGTDHAVPYTRTITAGTGLSGGGNLSANRTLSVNYGTTAGTAAQGNDSRLSDSREWTAATVSQAEAEAGTAITRRAWTAQRVRQAATAMFNVATTTFTRTLLGRTTAAQVRSDLELGTAATHDIGNNLGNVVPAAATSVIDFNELAGGNRAAGFFQMSGANAVNYPNSESNMGYAAVIQGYRNDTPYGLAIFANVDTDPKIVVYALPKSADGSRVLKECKLHTSANTTVDANGFLRSWGTGHAVPYTRTITAGTGLSGGGNLSANRTLSVNYGTTAGTAAQGNDSRINNGQTAYGWGNHASAGYALKTYTDTELNKKLNANENAVSASKLATARNIALSGAVAGSTSFDGSGNINITTTLQQSLGVGQTWQDIKNSRSFDTTYTNSSGKPIMVAVTSLGGSSGFNAFINGKQIIKNYSNYNTAGPEHGITIIVPNGASYMFGGSGGLSLWWELR